MGTIEESETLNLTSVSRQKKSRDVAVYRQRHWHRGRIHVRIPHLGRISLVVPCPVPDSGASLGKDQSDMNRAVRKN